jgi:hypothetical protein
MTPPLVSLEIADVLIDSGCLGITLSKLLHERFPRATLSEAFLAMAIFATAMQAELLLAHAELLQVRRAAIVAAR